jgi:hypothetical protein
MREKNIKQFDELRVYCTMTEYTEDPSLIKLPTYIHKDILKAQEKAIAPNWKEQVDVAYVYDVTIINATCNETLPNLSVLLSGEITIHEIIQISRDEDGTPHREGRTSISNG